MVTLEEISDSPLLQKPDLDDGALPILERTPSAYNPLHTFKLVKGRSYQQQYGDMYFLRLAKIKPAVEKVAADAWAETVIAGETARKVNRVLDVRQGELCWVAGTVYMEMPLKPNILEDVSRDRWISAPMTSQKYYAESEGDQIMLEDDSGRITLVGDILKNVHLVTGCIIAVMGTENVNGELEVLDVKFPDLPPQPSRWSVSKHLAGSGASKKDEDTEMSDIGGSQSTSNGPKIAIVSGLGFSGTDASHAVELNLLTEFLLGEALGTEAQKEAAQVSRLIIAGNSIATPEEPEEKGEKKHKKYGYDASSYNALPSQLFDDFLAEVLPSIPVTLLPGARDPANAAYPQQPIHTAMFPKARAFAAENPSEPGWFDAVTNPWEAEVEGWRILGTGGQNVDDVFKYVGSEDRLGMMEAMCRWRCSAPTAPDTLWSYPFQEDDPFVMNQCPHLYFVGCQPQFSTKLIHGPEGQSVRLVTIPSFAETKEIVLLDTETLDVTKVKITTTI